MLGKLLRSTVFGYFLISTLSVTLDAARILAAVPTPSYSHQVAFYPLWKALAKKGHNITLITTDPMNLENTTNIKQINVNFAYEILKRYNFSNFAKSHGGNPFKFVPKVIDMFADVIDAELSQPELKQLISNKNEHFDVAMVEVFMPGMVPFAVNFKCPLIGINSNDVFAWVHKSLGNPVHPVMYPDSILPYNKNANFWTRIKNSIVMGVLDIFLEWIIIPKQDMFVRHHFGEDIPSIKDIVKNMSLLFIAGDRLLQNSRPVGPNTIYIGGTSHIEDPKPLPKELQSFLDSANEGAIYFSLGSNIQSKDMTPEVQNIIIQVLSQLPYKVLWKFEADTLKEKTSNIKIMKWVPQHDILRHPNVKLFITQGGFQSVQEAIYNHVPMIVMPFFADQPGNANRIADQGLGLAIEPKSLTADIFRSAILEIMNNNRYQERVKVFSELTLDEPMTGLERAVWWTEYIIRHKGASQLRNSSADTPFYQYFMLDVIAVFSLLIVAVLYILLKVIRYIFIGICKLLHHLSVKKIKTH